MTVNVEALLREALTPVEPPRQLSEQLETTLAALTEAAQEELDGWELAAMGNPRNWVRPVARQHERRGQSVSLIQYAQRTLKDIAEEARRVLPDR
jgi:hypothetical protein